MLGIGRKVQTDEPHSNLLRDKRVCFVCQGTGFLPQDEQRGLRSIIRTIQNTRQHSAPKTNETPVEGLYKLECDNARLEKQKKALLKTVERIQRQQDILEQKKGQMQYEVIAK